VRVLARLKPEKLFVEYRQGITPTEPILKRYYTLTHSDETGDLFLTIGKEYAFDKINSMRDEVLGQWIKYGNNYYFYVYLLIDDGKFGPVKAEIRDKIFRRELPLALEAIRYGDRSLFKENKELDNSPIVVFFNSSELKYNKVEKWGSFSDYNMGYRSVKESGSRQHEILDDVIATLLNPYIEKEIFNIYKKKEKFCLKEVEVGALEALPTEDTCRPNYNVIVGLKVGDSPQPFNNFIINFTITPDRVITNSVKNPKYYNI
jgi:hypothetical protein